MINIINKEKCCGCAACANICPNSAITMIQDEEGFFYPYVDESKCIDCGLCNEVCQFNTELKSNDNPKVFAAHCNDNELRLNSSSGGVFTLLAECVLNNNGQVYGVSLSSDCRSCSYIKVEDKTHLQRLRGSKYFQAHPLMLYKEIEESLNAGRQVLFSGTGCQINALNSYLSKDFLNLITMDVICHGCPSQKLWDKHICNIENKNRDIVESVDFRNKKNGWSKYGIVYKLRNKEVFTKRLEDPFMYFFLNNYCLRPSCYNCIAKAHKTSDITLGDFWGVEELLPEMNDNLGTSLVLLRTEKGKVLFEKIKDQLKFIEVNYDNAVKKNSAEYKSVDRPSERDVFFADMNIMSFDELSKKYTKKNRYKRAVKQLLIKTGLWKIYAKISSR